MTGDIKNISTFTSYYIADQLQIGNGTCMHIDHIGSSIFVISNYPIRLSNMLHVPILTRNLLGLS